MAFGGRGGDYPVLKPFIVFRFKGSTATAVHVVFAAPF